MQYHARLRLSDEAEQSIRATLETLADCLSSDPAEELAAHLPNGIGQCLHGHTMGDLYVGQALDLNGFYQRVAERGRIPFLDAAFHTRAVMDVLQQAVPSKEIEKLLALLPKEYVSLFQSWSTPHPSQRQEQGNERNPGANRKA